MTTAQTNSLGLNGLHARQEFAIVRRAVGSRVNSAMAIRAKRYHKARIVRAAVGEAANVVRLEIGHAIAAPEWSRLAAPLALAFSARNNIVANVAAALEHGGSRLRFARSCVGCGESALAQFAQVRRRRRHLFDLLDHGGDWPQLEHDGVAHVSEAIRRFFDVVPLVEVLVLKSKAARRLLEEQKASTVARVVRNCGVPTLHGHVPDLALAEILKNAVGPEPIRVPVGQTFFARDNDYERVFGRRDDPALLLSAKLGVNVSSSVVDPAPLETPSHSFPRHSIKRVFASSGCVRVKAARLAE